MSSSSGCSLCPLGYLGPVQEGQPLTQSSPEQGGQEDPTLFWQWFLGLFLSQAVPCNKHLPPAFLKSPLTAQMCLGRALI